jgi:hypothetical protein
MNDEVRRRVVEEHERYMQDRFLVDGTLISNLLSEIKKDLGFNKNKDLLHMDATPIFKDNLNIFKNKLSPKISMRPPLDWNIYNEVKGKYQMIFGNFPWNVINGPDERELVLNSLDLLKNDGIGAFLMPPLLRTFKTSKGNIFKNQIHEKGFKVLAVIQMPDDFMRPLTSVKSILLFISKENKVRKTFFAKYQDTGLQQKMISFGIQQLYDLKVREEMDLNNEESAKILKDMTGLTPADIEMQEEKEANLYDGIEEDLDNFISFEHWERNKEITNLDSEYHGYKFVKLEELVEVKSTKDIYEDIEGSIYIPAIGRTEVIENMPTLESKKKPQNYFQVICNSERILSKYLYIYLNSDLGQKTIESELSKYSEATIRRLRVKDIKNLYISLPNLGIQEEIVENVSKLQRTKELLSSIEKSLSIKPISSSEQLAKLNQIYNSSMELSEPEIIFNEIKKGESTTREFKQTFALDIKSKKREEYIVHECVKTVAGFMNAGGGTLFIGVADNADITGIEVEVGKTKLHKSLDKYLNTIKNVFKSKIGSASLTNCNFRSVKIRGKKILKVDCKKSDHQVYVENKDTYVRMGPSTNKLEGPDLVIFSKERFS